MKGKPVPGKAGQTRAHADWRERWLLQIARRGQTWVLVALGMYALLPFAAPTLMKAGLTAPAQILYTVYSPFCHQMAFRSVFLFGEQAFYPRAAAYTDYPAFESFVVGLPEFAGVDHERFDARLIFAARGFLGNETMGYKTTLCARDGALYSALFGGGLMYRVAVVRRRLRPAPLWLYLLLGVAPIAIDGVSQLLSYPPFSLWPVRETTPEFRIMTGAVFGLMTAWLLFPYLEVSFRDMRKQLEARTQLRSLER
jgi:uncharacterized membrane protein